MCHILPAMDFPFGQKACNGPNGDLILICSAFYPNFPPVSFKIFAHEAHVSVFVRSISFAASIVFFLTCSPTLSLRLLVLEDNSAEFYSGLMLKTERKSPFL